MSIELAKITDLDALLEIENECFKDPYTRDDMLYELSQNPCSKILIFKKEWGFAGFLDFWITFDSATICQIGVKKSERRQGIGEALLLEAIKILKEENVEFFTLEVRASNTAAIALYTKVGFEKVTVKTGYYKDGEDAIYMVKGLI